MPPINHYEILGVQRQADNVDIKKAYKKAAMRLHPDKNPQGESMFKRVAVAYEVLKSPVERRKHDQALERHRTPAAPFSQQPRGYYRPAPPQPQPFNAAHREFESAEKERLYKEMLARRAKEDAKRNKQQADFLKGGLNFAEWYRMKCAEADDVSPPPTPTPTPKATPRAPPRAPPADDQRWKKEAQRKQEELAEMLQKKVQKEKEEDEHNAAAEAIKAEEAMMQIRRQREDLRKEKEQQKRQRSKARREASVLPPIYNDPLKEHNLADLHKEERMQWEKEKAMRDAQDKKEEEMHQARLREIQAVQRERQQVEAGVAEDIAEVSRNMTKHVRNFRDELRRERAKHERDMEKMRRHSAEQEREMLEKLELVRRAKREGKPIPPVTLEPLMSTPPTLSSLATSSAASSCKLPVLSATQNSAVSRGSE